MTTEQIAVRLPTDLLAEIDALVERGAFPSRAAVVRASVEALTADERRRAIDQAIIDGYKRIPPTADEDAWAELATREMIAEEPW